MDWTVAPDDADAVMAPYRAATAAAFTAFIADDQPTLDGWAKLRKEYRPLFALFAQAAEAAGRLGEPPEGLAGDAARLATPFAGQPFAAERDASVSLPAWRQAQTATDPIADAQLDALSQRLRRQLHTTD